MGDNARAQADSSLRKRILGYTNRLTVRPGESIEFKISVAQGRAYTAQLVRLINGDVHSKAAHFKEVEIDSPINGRYPGREQSIALGSCVVVDPAHALDALDELTVAITVMPTMPINGVQHLISRWDATTRTGWSLHLNDKGQISFMAADGSGAVASLSIAQPLAARTWYGVAVRVSWKTRTAQLDCHEIDVSINKLDVMRDRVLMAGAGEFPRCSCPVLMAAAFGGRDAAGRVVPAGCFNGRLEAPVIYDGLLSDAELGDVLAGNRPSSLSTRLVADWDFSDGISGTRIKDRSTRQLHGSIHNLPLRAVKGSRWRGTTMEWAHAPNQYAAIHFHSDDLYDCGWLTDITYGVPDELRSGIYALRLRRDDSESTLDEDYLPFFVAAPQGAPQSKIALLLPTYTYAAYGNVHLGPSRVQSGLPQQEFYDGLMLGPGALEYGLLIDAHREVGLSLYDHHVDGSPVHFSSWRRPLLNFRPKRLLWAFCADLLVTDWLEAQGFAYDVITDDLLQDEEAELLKAYPVVLTGNHPEYCTSRQLDAMESYLEEGGRLIYLGGNGFYWRTAVNPAVPDVVEVRRGRVGTSLWQSDVGEAVLAFTQEMGGIWRELGRPPQRLVGVGFIAEGKGGSHYRILPQARSSRAAFILEGVEGDVIGDFGIFEGAAGQEIDKSNANHGTPPHAVIVARSEQHGPNMLYAIEEMRHAEPVIDLYRAQTCAEVVFFETRNGGAVFSVGSMAWCGGLSHNGYDNNISKVTANVLNRFARCLDA